MSRFKNILKICFLLLSFSPFRSEALRKCYVCATFLKDCNAYGEKGCSKEYPEYHTCPSDKYLQNCDAGFGKEVKKWRQVGEQLLEKGRVLTGPGAVTEDEHNDLGTELGQLQKTNPEDFDFEGSNMEKYIDQCFTFSFRIRRKVWRSKYTHTNPAVFRTCGVTMNKVPRDIWKPRFISIVDQFNLTGYQPPIGNCSEIVIGLSYTLDWCSCAADYCNGPPTNSSPGLHCKHIFFAFILVFLFYKSASVRSIFKLLT